MIFFFLGRNTPVTLSLSLFLTACSETHARLAHRGSFCGTLAAFHLFSLPYSHQSKLLHGPVQLSSALVSLLRPDDRAGRCSLPSCYPTYWCAILHCLANLIGLRFPVFTTNTLAKTKQERDQSALWCGPHCKLMKTFCQSEILNGRINIWFFKNVFDSTAGGHFYWWTFLIYISLAIKVIMDKNSNRTVNHTCLIVFSPAVTAGPTTSMTQHCWGRRAATGFPWTDIVIVCLHCVPWPLVWWSSKCVKKHQKKEAKSCSWQWERLTDD